MGTLETGDTEVPGKAGRQETRRRLEVLEDRTHQERMGTLETGGTEAYGNAGRQERLGTLMGKHFNRNHCGKRGVETLKVPCRMLKIRPGRKGGAEL
ncbi:hypothetical protein GDO81_019540 [Engystomops pustulosus]|uniref:Uncharacterized protein n=1 Tax=Engystomops pustulosus TaxID=76066 RepID=A0AAV6YI85_ENGPU|nr:hypothetical protein GDO81_019540 [Engystomops pustulosus]